MAIKRGPVAILAAAWMLSWAAIAASSQAAEGDPAAQDPVWTLLHDDAALRDLKLTAEQHRALQALLDPLDLRLWPLRNQSPQGESGEAARKELAAILAEAKRGGAQILRREQAERLEQLVLRVQGTEALIRDDVAAKLKLTDKQRAAIAQEIADARQAKAKVRDEARAGKRPAAEAQQDLVRLATAERDAVVAQLTASQKQQYGKLIGAAFDLVALGNTRFKAPELVGDRQAWIGSEPQTLQSLRGRVVVLHFFAFGCINCIHNYPSYRKWQAELVGDDVVLIGIHTPETKGEHNVATLQKKLQDESLTFPVLVDNNKANWNAWGNHWWPAVYVIDQQGYMRAHWPGELKWQGQDGEAAIESRVRALVAAERK